MNTELDATLRQVAEDTFQSLAFIFPAEGDADAPLDAASGLEPRAGGPQSKFGVAGVAVEFTGPFGGRMTLGVSYAMLPVLAANMLGLDEGTLPSDDQQDDALKELLNVICGNVLPALAGTESVFNVQAPRLMPPPRPDDFAAAPPPQSGPSASRCSPLFGWRPLPGATACVELCLDAGLARIALYCPDLADRGAAKIGQAVP